MNLKIKGRLAIVTGSTSGIGRAIAKSLLDEGARVVINGRSQETVSRTLEEMSGDAHGIVADVSTAAGCEKLIAEAEKLGDIDILVNNAGIFEPQPFDEIDDASWQKFYEVNVLSGVRMSRGVMRGMQERGWGRIIFISSESAINIPVEMVHYGMTKTAQLAISRGLAKTLKDTGVTVNSVLPGPTWSEGVEEFVERMAADEGQSVEETKQDFFKQARPSSLIQRFATTEEVAALVAYLCGEPASATTGAAMRCEGGIVDTCF